MQYVYIGRLLVNKRSKRIEKISVIGLYMLCECGNLKKENYIKIPSKDKIKCPGRGFLFIYFVSRSKSPTRSLTLYRRCCVLLLLHNPVEYKNCHNYCNSYYISEKCRMNKHKSACRNNNTGNHVHSCEAVALKS